MYEKAPSIWSVNNVCEYSTGVIKQVQDCFAFFQAGFCQLTKMGGQLLLFFFYSFPTITGFNENMHSNV